MCECVCTEWGAGNTCAQLREGNARYLVPWTLFPWETFIECGARLVASKPQQSSCLCPWQATGMDFTTGFLQGVLNVGLCAWTGSILPSWSSPQLQYLSSTQPPTGPSQLEDVQTSAGLGLVMLPELTKKDQMCGVIPAAPQSVLEAIRIQK